MATAHPPVGSRACRLAAPFGCTTWTPRSLLSVALDDTRLAFPSVNSRYCIAAVANNNPRLIRGLLEKVADFVLIEVTGHDGGDNYDQSICPTPASSTAGSPGWRSTTCSSSPPNDAAKPPAAVRSKSD